MQVLRCSYNCGDYSCCELSSLIYKVYRRFIRKKVVSPWKSQPKRLGVPSIHATLPQNHQSSPQPSPPPEIPRSRSRAPSDIRCTLHVLDGSIWYEERDARSLDVSTFKRLESRREEVASVVLALGAEATAEEKELQMEEMRGRRTGAEAQI